MILQVKIKKIKDKFKAFIELLGSLKDIKTFIIFPQGLYSIKNNSNGLLFDNSFTMPTTNYKELPTDLKDDEVILFNSKAFIHLKSNGDVLINAKKIKIVGDVEIIGNVINNGVNISSTHIHIDSNNKETSTPQ
jgi:hypothetical protein